MSLHLSRIIPDYLHQNAPKAFTARELAQWIFDNFPAECREKFERSQEKNKELKILTDIIVQIQSEIGAQYDPEYPAWRFIQRIKDVQPDGKRKVWRYFYLEPKTQQTALPIVKEILSISKIAEKDLYPLLAKYAQNHLKVFLRRIDEKRGSNLNGPGGNHWLYPDMVGLEDLSGDWHEEVRECVKHNADRRTRMWSFEVKVEITRANVRECFFQTLSNSSWAHFAYLVASNIIGGDGTIKELQILCAAHGIGFILLDAQNIENSKILIPAREKENVDWMMVNRLAIENKDFLEYLKATKRFYQVGYILPHDWFLE